MDGLDPQQPTEKPFSVLEKFRQLKKDKEQISETSEESAKMQESSSGTVFQASGLSSSQSNEKIGAGGYRHGRGRPGFGRGRGKRRYDNSEMSPKRTTQEHWKGQREKDVGITEFIRTGPGFDVILKHRYSDFHVHEIDMDGNVVKLTTTELVKDTEEAEVSSEVDTTTLSPEQWTALNEIVEKRLPGTVDIDVTDLSKEKRQQIHQAIKRRFGVHVFSNTNTIDQRKTMQIGYGAKENKYKYPCWPQGRGEYLHFVLHKENCDMTEAIIVISRYTGIKTQKFGYAGNKDKRAVTTQQMCCRRAMAERFQSSCTNLRGISVGNFCYKWTNLRLGDLKGNRFKLVLRNVKASDEVILEAIESFKNSGFINYFGMQRFGSSATVPTYMVGQAILKGNWKLATELVLKPRPGEATYQDVKEARDIWWETRNANAALKPFFRKDKSIEGKILLGLRKHGPNAYQNAFDSLPRNTVTLYLHSYQSLVWNKVVSRRVREFGLRVLPGDLLQITSTEEADKLLFRMQENAQFSDSSDDESEESGKDGCKIQVKVLSAEEAETASIYDVVYPLPGDDIRFPDNEIAQWYTEMLEADGNPLSYFGNVQKKYGMYGTYRKMLATAEDLNWSTLRYSEPDENLLLSDLDILKEKPALSLDPDGPYKALIVEFSLKVCTYATMAIRELTKCETSVASQTKRTQDAKEEDMLAKKLKAELTQCMEVESENKAGENDCDTSTNKVQNEKSDNYQESEGKTNTTQMDVESEEICNSGETEDNCKGEGDTDVEKSSGIVDGVTRNQKSNLKNTREHKEET